MFDTVLVANRGEIAVRIFATLRRMGVGSVAIYSDEDASARHVREADRALRVGPTPALESYLNVERVIDAARQAGAQAVHPGYGFLSENANFVRACEEAGLVFIGPSAESVELMGDKIRAKAAVAAAGVAVVPGRADARMSDDDLIAAAADVGYPVLVKPSAGGGGKGMRLVDSPEDLPAALLSARRESAASFGDDTLFLERFVAVPRHLEVQVLFDARGHGVHLGERECSLQRRHQKVIEEAPSPLLDERTRAALCAAALRVGEVAHYRGAGTVEFIVSSRRPDEFFFMEMNTRLQVEHPVTEMVTGVDLVEQQLRVAAGESLSFTQDDVRRRGHAIEARVYAEDPARDFLPTGGTLFYLREPRDEGVRLDTSLSAGSHVGTTYDPMVAKVVAHAPTRPEALARLERALGDLVTFGVVTNTTFLRTLLGDEHVRAGVLDTDLIARVVASDGPHESATELVVRSASLAVAFLARLTRHGAGHSRFDEPDGWRVGERAATTLRVEAPGSPPHRVEVSGTWRGATVLVDGQSVSARCGGWREREPDVYELAIGVDATIRRVVVGFAGPWVWIWCDGSTTRWRLVPPVRANAVGDAHSGEVRSPMPGVVIAVEVERGGLVSSGDTLAVVEAMKMEHAVRSPLDGHVVDLLVAPGDQVALDQILARVSAVPTAEPPEGAASV